MEIWSGLAPCEVRGRSEKGMEGGRWRRDCTWSGNCACACGDAERRVQGPGSTVSEGRRRRWRWHLQGPGSRVQGHLRPAERAQVAAEELVDAEAEACGEQVWGTGVERGGVSCGKGR